MVRVPCYRFRGLGFNSQNYPILWQAIGLEWDALSLVRITEELREWKSGGSCLGNWELRLWGAVGLTTQHNLPPKLAITSPTSGGRSLGIVRLLTTPSSFFVLNLQQPTFILIYFNQLPAGDEDNRECQVDLEVWIRTRKILDRLQQYVSRHDNSPFLRGITMHIFSGHGRKM
jgi:hypothetical protein